MTNDTILAKVNGMPIMQSDVDNAVASYLQRGQNLNTPEGKKIVLEQLINHKLFVAEAQKNLYEYDPQFKAQFEKMKEDLLANFAIAKTVEKISVTEEEIKDFYEKNKVELMSGETVNASHILVDTEDEAKSILDDINSSKISFEDAARKYSKCPSKEQGGCLGDFGKGQMVPEFDSACFSMNEGEIKGPVKTQFGYHLIKLNSKSESKQIDFSEIKDQIREKIYADKQQAAYKSKINQLKILFPVDKF